MNKRLLIDPLDTESDHPCRLVNYTQNYQEFRCLLDRNVVSYLISLTARHEVKSELRYTAALQAFLNIAEIQSDPGLAYHEYMDSSGIEKADKELALFRAADNVNANYYVDLALGNITSIPKVAINTFSNGELFDKAKQQPPKLKYFEANKLCVKKALILKSCGYTDYQVMLELVDWVKDEYLFTAPAFHFLSIYFSSKRISNMLKSHSLAGVDNAAWDLCLVQELISRNKNDPTHVRWLLSTFDKAIKATIDLAFKKYYEDIDSYISRLEHSYSEMWGRKNGHGKRLLKKLSDFRNSANDESRNIVKYDWSSEYILSLRESIDNEFCDKVLAKQS
ncbi:hypothetical protein [Candidatus Albibeggiatoa sp. nov. NOAA]|uniref:hypothetical protein n=1 Tax=Candidatus Albibeggiatoa sp. nov. NOAA TaxID=3162724 RepID=UPI003302F61A|nr:hypothetical protein [Thiotrichaceae bacterium]